MAVESLVSLRNDIMRFSISGFGSDIRIELQAPVVRVTQVPSQRMSILELLYENIKCQFHAAL